MADYEAMMMTGGAEALFKYERDEAAQERDGLDKTFSAEAMDDLIGNMGAWVGTRIARAGRLQGVAPQSMEVEVRVKLDGEWPGGLMHTLAEFPAVVDGQTRQDAGS